MKSLYLARFSWLYAALLVSLQSLPLFAQSPDSLAGRTIDMRISTGTPPFGSSGRFLLIFRGNTQYISYNVTGASDDSGAVLYQRNGFYTGRLTFGNLATQLTFADTNSGSFYSGFVNSPAYQAGTFNVINGAAPSELSGKLIRFESDGGGDLPFGESGTYRIIPTSSSSYVVQNASGTIVHSGSYSYAKANRSSAVFQFQDTTHAGGFVVLGFETGNEGISLVRKSTNQLYQTGKFRLANLRAPVFAKQPASRSVPIGTSTTFSATVTGTGPFTYQWYKDNSLIGGATGSSYTLPSVQMWDAGNYQVVATGIAGSVTSSGALLTPECSYSVSTGPVQHVDFRGGDRDMNIAASGTCPWTASTTNAWITILSATAGQGNATLSYMIEANESDTPRTGYLQVAGKTVIIVQGARFASPSLAGKTIRLDFDQDTEDALLVFGSGTNSQVQLVSFDTNSPLESLDYEYFTTTSSNAVVRLSGTDLLLNYESVRKGLFVVTNESEVMTGNFVVSPSSPDFNGDARGDLVIQKDSGVFAAWHFQNTNYLGAEFLHGGRAPNNGARAFGTGDFNQDGHSDILLQDRNGRILVWFMNGTNRLGGAALRDGVVAPAWRPFAVADVNSDGHPDILFQHRTDLRISAWLFEGTAFKSGFPVRNGIATGAAWRAVGAADLDGDGQTDILLQNASGAIAAWFLNAGEFLIADHLREGVAPVKWKVTALMDLNEDGNMDIIWQNIHNQQVAGWLFDGKEFIEAMLLRDGKAAGFGWKVVAPR